MGHCRAFSCLCQYSSPNYIGSEYFDSSDRTLISTFLDSYGSSESSITLDFPQGSSQNCIFLGMRFTLLYLPGMLLPTFA